LSTNAADLQSTEDWRRHVRQQVQNELGMVSAAILPYWTFVSFYYRFIMNDFIAELVLKRAFFACKINVKATKIVLKVDFFTKKFRKVQFFA